MKSKLIVILLGTLLPVFAPGQTEEIDEDIQFHSKELDRLRQEIEDFQDRIKETAVREKSTLEMLSEVDEEISLVRNLLYRLKKEETAKKKAIEKTKMAIASKEREYEELQDRYSRRVVDVYKKGRLSDLEVLLDSDSWRQAVYRSKYLRIISHYDKRIAREVRLTLQQIADKKASLERDLKDLERIDAERSSRKERLERSRRVRNRELIRLKKDHQELSKALDERRSAAQELEKIIDSLEREKAARLAELERRRREAELLGAADFVSLKGKLPWPAEGTIISRFGSHRNPSLKTVTQNTGIDIRGKPGSGVKAVFDGIVTTVTYIRGYGNTVIIDHGDGYYTVYTHVRDVEVGENSYVKALEVIAHVGDSGSLEGAKLHFEIWGNRQKLNPEEWLRKS
ncbi:MAG: murein hydrolase activator EnvC family protein [Fidelibacterota bacterium]